jgi:hypothetical protein
VFRFSAVNALVAVSTMTCWCTSATRAGVPSRKLSGFAKRDPVRSGAVTSGLKWQVRERWLEGGECAGVSHVSGSTFSAR